MFKKLKFWKTAIEETQSYVPKWSRFTSKGEYEESEEFKMIVWETNYLIVFGVRVWVLSTQVKEQTPWHTAESFYEEIHGRN